MSVLELALSTFAKACIWDILREECGASDGAVFFADFDMAWPKCVEYRFGGNLGAGGKVWCSLGQVYVNCYREDKTPERSEAIDAANARLERFVRVNLGLESRASSVRKTSEYDPSDVGVQE